MATEANRNQTRRRRPVARLNWGIGLLAAIAVIAVCGFRIQMLHDPFRRIRRPVIPEEQPPPSAVPLPVGYTTYGPFDKDGIPIREWAGQLGMVYHPLVVAEFGCTYHGLWHSTGETRYRDGQKKMAGWLVAHQDSAGRWIYDWPFSYGGLSIRPPWHSAVTQGNAAQALTAAFSVLGDQQYLDCAARGLKALPIPFAEGGLRIDTSRGWFFEEYPMRPPTHVLNGHMRAVLACLDFLQVREDPTIRHAAEQGIRGLEDTLEHFDTGWWSRYDLLPPVQGNTQWLVAVSSGRVRARVRYAGRSYQLEWKKQPKPFLGFERLSETRPLPDGKVYAARLHLRPAEHARIKPEDGEVVVCRAHRLRGLYLTWKENPKRLIALWEGSTDDEMVRVTVPAKPLGHSTGKPYHQMMIGQLERLAEAANRELFRQVATRWRAYADKRGKDVQPP